MIKTAFLSTIALCSFAAPPHSWATNSSFKVVQIRLKNNDSFKGYLYSPGSDQVLGGILYLHGGPDEANPVEKNPVREHLLSQGYVVLDIDYRNTLPRPNWEYPLPSYDCHLVADADIEDSLAAIGYLKQITGSEKIHVVGASNGGIIATRLAFHFSEAVGSVINIEGMSGRLRYVVPPNCEPDKEKHYPYDFMNEQSIKNAAPMFSYYGTLDGFALPAGQGRLDHEDSDMIHGYKRVAESSKPTTDFHYSIMPIIDSRHVYVEYPDGHFPKEQTTLLDLLPKITAFLKSSRL